MKGEIKALILKGLPSVFSLSEKIGAFVFWRWFARMDPYLKGTGYSLVIADALYAQSKRKDAQNLLIKNILTFLDHAPPRFIRPSPTGQEAIPKAEGSGSGKPACLRDLYAVLDPLGVRPFLAFGTLLGFVRENGFIRNDGDIDIGIFYFPSDVDRIAEALVKKGFSLTRRDGSAWPCRIKCKHENGTKVDIVFFHRKDGKLQTYCEYRKQRIFRERAGFELKRAVFQSVPVWIPEKPEAFLEENYLDWKTPQAKSHPLFTSALTDYSQDIIRFFALRHLYQLLAVRNREGFEFYLDLFGKRSPSDTVWPEIHYAYKAGLPE